MFMMILIVYLYVKEEKYVENVNDFHSFMQMWRKYTENVSGFYLFM